MAKDRESTDEALAQRAREGDEDAFRELFDRYAPVLRKRVRRRLPALIRRKIAESDVVQMAYMSVHKSLPQYREQGEGSFRAWLWRILDRRIADVLRRYVETSKRSIGREVSGPQPLSGARRIGREGTPSVIASGEELRSAIATALDHLSKDHRRILQLVQADGLTLSEAGKSMGRSTGAAKQLFARALSRLRRLVREGGGSGDD